MSLRTVNVTTDEELQALKSASCAQSNARVLLWQQAGFGRQQVGCRCTGAEVNEVLRRFLPVGKACVGSALAGRVEWLLAGWQTLYN
jgi:hypothetical protein